MVTYVWAHHRTEVDWHTKTTDISKHRPIAWSRALGDQRGFAILDRIPLGHILCVLNAKTIRLVGPDGFQEYEDLTEGRQFVSELCYL